MITRFRVFADGKYIREFIGKEKEQKAQAYANKYEDECNLKGYFPKVTIVTDTLEGLSGKGKTEFQKYGYMTNR